MHILVINFNAETSPDQFNDLVKEDAPIFAETAFPSKMVWQN